MKRKWTIPECHFSDWNHLNVSILMRIHSLSSKLNVIQNENLTNCNGPNQLSSFEKKANNKKREIGFVCHSLVDSIHFNTKIEWNERKMTRHTRKWIRVCHQWRSTWSAVCFYSYLFFFRFLVVVGFFFISLRHQIKKYITWNTLMELKQIIINEKIKRERKRFFFLNVLPGIYLRAHILIHAM